MARLEMKPQVEIPLSTMVWLYGFAPDSRKCFPECCAKAPWAQQLFSPLQHNISIADRRRRSRRKLKTLQGIERAVDRGFPKNIFEDTQRNIEMGISCRDAA